MDDDCLILYDSHIYDYYHSLFSYDKETGVLTRKKGQFSGRKQGTLCQGYIVVFVCGKMVKAHRIIWMMENRRVPRQIDHIDGNRSNNLLSNLRETNVAGNAVNKFTKRAKRNKPIGVKFLTGRYYAEIYSDRKRIPLGGYDTEQEAAHAYNKAAISLRGEYAKLNPI